jgi:hypothetical protein
MIVQNFTRYPSLDEQAIEVSNNLHDELHITIDKIRMDVSPDAAVLVYVQLINQAKRMLMEYRGNSK